MRSRALSALLFTALVATPAFARKGAGGAHGGGGAHGSGRTQAAAGHFTGGGSGGSVPTTAQGYHSSAGYGSAYGPGYKDWTHNGWHNGEWHAIPYSDKAPKQSASYGPRSATSASPSETDLINQRIAERRAQQAKPSAAPSQQSTSAGSAQKP